MKVGDLVRAKNDDVLGLIVGVNEDAEPSLGVCWHVFYFDYCGTPLSIPAWETELEVISEVR